LMVTKRLICTIFEGIKYHSFKITLINVVEKPTCLRRRRFLLE
jgi:hypothetical protein